MRLRDIFRQRLRSLFRRTGVESDLDEELRYHVERQVEENLAAGMPPREARQAAIRAFADFEQTKEECRDMRQVNLIDSVRQDLRFTARQLARNPGFTATAVLVLALGLCTSVAIFAFVDAALIKPLPYPDPNHLAGVYEHTPQCPRCNLSYLDFLDWKKLNKVFVSLEVYNPTGMILNTPTGAQPAGAAGVSDGFFRALGVTPFLGRDFRPGEDPRHGPLTAVLSYPAWQQRYGADRAIIGRSATLDGASYSIIGVLPRDFQFAPTGRAEYYVLLNPDGSCHKRRGCHDLYGVARLKDGVSVESALADTALIARQLETQYPDSNRGQGAMVVPLAEVIVGNIRPIVLILLAGAALLLLIACVNVASLLLVRSESRRHEMAVRGALGASRGRLVRQFVTEGMALVAAGTLLGTVAAVWIMRLLTRLIPTAMMSGLPFLEDLGMNLHVLAFALAVALLAVALFALTPAARLPLTHLRDGLAEGGRGSAGNTWRRLGGRLVVLELASATVLLVGAGLLGQSLYRLLRVSLGIQPDHVATLQVDASPVTYGKDPQAIALARDVLRRMSELPGVQSAALTSFLPVTCNCNTDWVRFVGKPYDGHHNEINERDVSPAYFVTLRARLLRGRYFTDADDESKASVAIVNQSFAAKYFPGEDPIGRQYGDTDLTPKSIRTVIGVVDDVRESSLDTDNWPTEYIPFNQSPGIDYYLVVRAAQPPESMLAAMAATLRKLDPGIATSNAQTMPDRIADSPSAYIRRSSAWLVGGFAAIALLLGVVGLYGVIAYSVRQRTREIGVRIALGAERASVYRLILREAGSLAAMGILAGLVVSVIATTALRKLLFGVQSWDIPTLIGVSAVLAIAALIAGYIPARRAASVDPVQALRAE
ncbi:MAG TPA: ABC transporter permease [Bryobacteraceae bacterium]|nr:ABC transporter permease [Bryobacteraceae bacterium]